MSWKGSGIGSGYDPNIGFIALECLVLQFNILILQALLFQWESILELGLGLWIFWILNVRVLQRWRDLKDKDFQHCLLGIGKMSPSMYRFSKELLWKRSLWFLKI